MFSKLFAYYALLMVYASKIMAPTGSPIQFVIPSFCLTTIVFKLNR